MLRPGQVLDGKYRVARLLGEGGMGAVFQAEHTLIHRRCAIKVLHPEVARNEEVVKRFVREAQAASAIGHPGIIDIYDVGVTPDGAPYLVMEFIEGRSLAGLLAAQRKLPVAQAVDVVVQALAALAVAHARGIVHRDLKPDNLFIRQAPGSPPATKILDFGISHVDAGGRPEAKLTRTGSVLGTPLYMAPEQAGGLPGVDHRLDLYAMGVILYECLTGRLPFQAENYNRLIVMILSEPFAAPREIDPAIPPGLEAVVLKAMSRQREDRYDSADEMIRALVPFLTEKARARLDLSLPGGASAVAATAAALGLTRRCPKCGRRYDDASRICSVDGAALEVVSAGASPPPVDREARPPGRVDGTTVPLARQVPRPGSRPPMEPTVVAATVPAPTVAAELPAAPVPAMPAAGVSLATTPPAPAEAPESWRPATTRTPSRRTALVAAVVVLAVALTAVVTYFAARSGGRGDSGPAAARSGTGTDGSTAGSTAPAVAALPGMADGRGAGPGEPAEPIMPCPEGKHREGTECVWDPCPEEHHREGSECVLDPCPTGTFRLGGTGRCIADGTWVTVRAGSFEMGSPASEQGHNDDETQHHVTLTRDYALLSTEVTQGQFEARMGYNPSKFAACGSNCPVEQVTWHEAAAYCNVLSAAGGYESCFSCGGSGKDVVCEPTASHGSPYQCPGYRLPTEAEWEHAARAGMATATYGGDLDRSHLECQRPNAVLDPIAWFCGNSGVTYDGAVDGREWGGLRAMGTHPVGGKGANPWGLHDMLGNVYEWCWDWYGEYAAGSATDPWGPAAGSSRAFRGGSWLGIARDARAASRYGFGPARRGDALGLRPSRSLP